MGSSGAPGSGHGKRRQALAHLGQVGGAGGRIHQRDPVQQEAAGEGAEQEVLQRCFARAGVLAVEADQDVEGQREDLQPEEDGHEVAGDGHHPHAGRGQEQQGVECARMGREVADALDGKQAAQPGGDQHGRAENSGPARRRAPWSAGPVRQGAAPGWRPERQARQPGSASQGLACCRSTDRGSRPAGLHPPG